MINPNYAHIWYIAFNSQKLLNINELFQILNENEKIKSKSFIKQRDQQNYIISHAYLRLLLTRYHPDISQKSWKFSKNSYGKPFLSKEHNVAIHFNISHTDSAVSYIFTRSSICGIDIEEDRDIILDRQIINLVLSDKEKSIYQTSRNKNTLFYRFWTLKEAYLKAYGTGLSQEVQQFDYSFVKNIDSELFVTFNQEGYYYGTSLIDKTYLSYSIKSLSPLKINFNFL